MKIVWKICMAKSSRLTLHTYTNRIVDPFNLAIDDFCIEDIAHALSLLTRWGGHTKTLCSVAEHSLNVAFQVYFETHNLDTTFAALMHDATEAYVQDLVSPIKARLKSYRDLEHKVEKLLFKHFKIHLSTGGKKIIKKCDIEVRHFERRLLTMPAPRAEKNFLRLFNFLNYARVHGASDPLIRSVFRANLC